MRCIIHLIVALLPVGALASDLANVVKIDSGLVAGSGTAVRSYKGIPYAAPPIGELRWQPPQPVKSWTTIRVAKSFSLACPQAPTVIAKAAIGEDCLSINVWTPAQRGNERLPVLVSIYGGGFLGGGSSLGVDHGERLASQGVVVITFNYRLGISVFSHTRSSTRNPRAQFRQLCFARHGGGARVDPAQCRRFRWRPGQCDHLGRIGGRNRGQSPDGDAASQGSLPQGDRQQCLEHVPSDRSAA